MKLSLLRTVSAALFLFMATVAQAQDKDLPYYNTHEKEILPDARAAFSAGRYDRVVELCRWHFILVGGKSADKLQDMAENCSRLSRRVSELYAEGKKTEALEEVRTLLSLNPDDSAAKKLLEELANNVILYTSSDGVIVTPNKTDVFGAAIVSNEYIDGRGAITFDGDVTSIGEYAFYGCTGLTSIKIPNSVTSIAHWAFYGCTGLTSIEIPNSVTSLDHRAFSDCSGLTTIVVDPSNPVYDSRNQCNAIIRTDTNELVMGFSSTIIPNSVTNIGYGAFYGCTGLTSIEIPNSVTSIRDKAFYGCTSLTSIEIPNSVTLIVENSFSRCSGLSTIVVDPGNPVYDSRNQCNAIIETDTNKLCAGCSNTVIPNSVASIGGGAFDGCTGLTSIKIPKSVTSIGAAAFFDCTGLTSIEIPNSVTSIGDSAFSGCTGLTSIKIPNSVTSIGDYAFSSCSGLTTIFVDSSNPVYDSRNQCNAIIKTNTNELIAGCSNTVIPNSVASIGEEAFRGCTGLTLIEIPNSVTSIGDYAITHCYELTSIILRSTIPPSLGHIAFESSADYIYVPAGSVDDYKSRWSDYADRIQPFYTKEELAKLDSQDIPQPNNVIYYTSSVVWPVTPNKTDVYGATIVSNEYSGGAGLITFDGGVTSIEHIDGRGIITFDGDVTSIGDSAFSGCTSLTSIKIPNSVTSIGEQAFIYCTGLTSIKIPNSVTGIGDSAFYGCTDLTSIEIPNSVTHIGVFAFSNCTGLTSVEIPNSVTRIGDSAFSGCTGLTSIEIPNSVTHIGVFAFSNCTGLTSVEIPNSVTSIGKHAFSSCSGLTTIVVDSSNPVYDSRSQCNAIIRTDTNELVMGFSNTVIPNSVTRIGDSAFSGCTGLTSIKIPNSVTSIDHWAFYGCTGLTSIEIPNSVTSIDHWAFYGCSGLTTIVVDPSNPVYDSRNQCNAIIRTDTSELVMGFSSTIIPNSVTRIGDSAFYGCTGLTSIEIPDSVTDIDVFAFSNCTGLTSIEIHNSVKSIGASAFNKCTGLTSVEIPNSVTSIGYGSFYDCTGLTSIIVRPVTPSSLGDDAFYSTNGCPIYVPAQAVKNYKSKWSKYATRIQPLSSN